MEIIKKNKGSIAIFAFLIIGFLSWAIFSTSFLLSEETIILENKYEINKLENKRNILEEIFKIYIMEIEKEINNDHFANIIEYVCKKDDQLIFLNNYLKEPISDSGFQIVTLIIKNSKGKKYKFDFSKKKKNYKYLNLFKNYSQGPYNTGEIIFQKKMQNISIEGFSQTYVLTIQGEILISFNAQQLLNKNNLKKLTLKELIFKIDNE